ncbi:MAG: diguanylate cyclase [Gammaproteobacteria bacterium]|nr:MAG: diguanylate cyclase [Gammaproteobacteria bacterium]
MINLDKKIVIQALDCGLQALLVINARDKALPVVYVNPAFETLTGLDASEVIGAGIDELIMDGELPERVDARVGDRPADGDRNLEQAWKLKAGGSVRLNVRLSALYERPGTPSFWLLTEVARADSSPGEAALRHALHDARRRLKSLERTDPAAGVADPAGFMEVLQRDWSIARREQRRLGIVVFQVDCLDAYRDVFGRHAADSLLRKIGHLISGLLRRAGDFGAWLGDGQFAVLIGSATDAQVLAFAERAVHKVRNLAIHHPRSPIARFVTLSFGSATEVPAWTAASNTLLEHVQEQLVRRQAEAAASRADNAPSFTTQTDLQRITR